MYFSFLKWNITGTIALWSEERLLKCLICVKVILWLTSKWESCSELTAVKLKTLLIWLINRFDSGLYASSRWGTGRGVFDSAWVVWLRRLDIFLSLCRSALRNWCPAMIGNNGRYLSQSVYEFNRRVREKNKANGREISLLGDHRGICKEKWWGVIWVFLQKLTVWNWLMIAVKSESDTPAGGHAAIDPSFCALLTFFFFSVRRWHGKSMGNR